MRFMFLGLRIQNRNHGLCYSVVKHPEKARFEEPQMNPPYNSKVSTRSTEHPAYKTNPGPCMVRWPMVSSSS